MARQTKIQNTRPDPRSTRPVDLDAFERRLRRLARGCRRYGFDDGRVVFDFHLGEKIPRKAGAHPDIRDAMKAPDMRRGEGSKKSVAFFEVGESGGYDLVSYCIRLDDPELDGLKPSETCRRIAPLVEDAAPPPETLVWVRKFTTGLYFSPVPLPDYFSAQIPHIAAEDLAAHPVVLLDFIAEFIPEYRAQLL